MYKSWFEYNITKPYPYRWFTPLVVTGATVLIVVFSILNLAAQGYQFQTIYTSDPNTTLVEYRKWFMEPPFNWGTSLQPTCEPFLLSVGHHFFTTNFGFSYEVTSISTFDEALNQTKSLASIPYLNNTFETCQTKRVTINLERTDLAPSVHWWFSFANSDTSTWVQCSIQTESGPVNLTFRVAYGGSGGGLSGYDYVINDNHITHASIWWGTRLLDAYWNGIMSVMARTQPLRGLIMRVNLDYLWKGDSQKSIRDLDLFDFSFFFFYNDSLIDRGPPDRSRMLYNKTLYSTPALTQGLFWTKIIHSALMVDLGIKGLPNFLLSVDDLTYLLSGAGDIVREAPGIFQMPGYDAYAKIPQPDVPDDYTADLPDDANTTRVLITHSYDVFGARMGPLGTREARVYAQYACQIPVPKSTGTMILSIVIANLVVLQAAWRLLSIIGQQLVAKQQETAMFCKGCQERGYQSVDMDNISLSTSNPIGIKGTMGESTQRLLDAPSPAL